jgi:hypothetical protein
VRAPVRTALSPMPRTRASVVSRIGSKFTDP